MRREDFHSLAIVVDWITIIVINEEKELQGTIVGFVDGTLEGMKEGLVVGYLDGLTEGILLGFMEGVQDGLCAQEKIEKIQIMHFNKVT